MQSGQSVSRGHVPAQSGSRPFFALVRSIATAAAVCAALPALATAEKWMSDQELRDAFSGATVDGHYGNGQQFRESFDTGGRLSYTDAHRSSEGNWSVETGTLCTIYDTDPSGGCFRVKKVGGNCYEFFFVARTENKARTDPLRPSWTARGSIAGEPGKCAEERSV